MRAFHSKAKLRGNNVFNFVKKMRVAGVVHDCSPPRRQRQENPKFEGSLNSRVRTCLRETEPTLSADLYLNKVKACLLCMKS